MFSVAEPESQSPELDGVFSIGDCIADKYVVERVIGAGGMGVVVAARHKTLGKPVAVKFLLPAVAEQAEPRERFLREARAAIEIRSEHVAHVTDVGTLESGAPYMVMEYLEGQDLDQTLETDGPLSVDEALDLVLQACEALTEAHARGLVHRDIKPANLFVTYRADGSPLVKLLDFGISRAAIGAKDEQRLTATHTVLGTPTYMAPEQLRGARNADARSDLWAVGATLHELLCGEPPFDGETMTALCVAIVEQQPTPLGQLVSEIPPGLEAAVLKCLNKDPAGRFPSVAAFAAAIEPFAPPSAKVAIDMIISIEDHGLSGAKLSPAERRSRGSRRSHDSTAHSETVPGYDPGDSSPRLAQTGVAPEGSGGGDTVGSWQAGRPPKRGRAGLLVAAVALLAVAAVVSWSAFRDDRAAESLTKQATSSPSTVPSAPTTTVTNSEPAEPTAAAAASETTTSSAPPSAAVPPVAPGGPSPKSTARPPTTAGTGKIPSPPSEVPVDPIGDRK